MLEGYLALIRRGLSLRRETATPHDKEEIAKQLEGIERIGQQAGIIFEELGTTDPALPEETFNEAAVETPNGDIHVHTYQRITNDEMKGLSPGEYVRLFRRKNGEGRHTVRRLAARARMSPGSFATFERIRQRRLLKDTPERIIFAFGWQPDDPRALRFKQIAQPGEQEEKNNITR